MRTVRTAYLAFVCLALASCSSPTTLIGTACANTKSCNVEGQVCVLSICTKPCTQDKGDTGCPAGYYCTDAGAGAGLTCNKTPFAVDETGKPVLFNVDCSLDANVCVGTADPNTAPSCRKAEDPKKRGMPLANDSEAYCTGACTDDKDCPTNMFCNTDYDSVKKCMQRDQCAPCKHNFECPANFGCVATKDGTSTYCTQRCASQDSCPGAAQQIAFEACTTTQDTDGNSAGYCLHKYGACVGTGEICDPCLTKADCAKSGSTCITNTLTGEKMCSKACTTDAMCGGPHNSTCDNTDPMYSLGICTGDTTPGKIYATVFSCWP
jgi:hypothetical protein